MKFPEVPILLVDDETEFLFSAELILKSERITNVQTCSDSRKVKDLMEKHDFSVVLFDMSMPYVSGFELLEYVTERFPHIPVIILTALQDVELAVNSMKLGAFEYILKPIQESALVGSIKRAIEHAEIKNENLRLKEKLLVGGVQHPENFVEIVTTDEKMHSLFSYIEAIAKTHLPVLVQGDTGVGKELFAQAIHKSSERKGELVAVNVAGVDDNMFSDTLFGHVKGAFTGADTNRKGLIEQAQNGTLFLDEIGDLSNESQVKLLRLIQENKYYPVGSDEPKVSNARIIVATHKDLNEMQKSKSFRSDLYYRLQSHKILIPALRERKADLEKLTEFLLEKASNALGKKKPTVPKALYTLLKNYSFPGNIRELEGIIVDAVSRHQGGVLSMDTFREKIDFVGEDVVVSEDVQHNEKVKFGDVLPTLKEVEEQLIDEALKRSEGNQSIAANLIGLSRRALNNRLNR
ncbi:sigma-54-dependent Fis family transcriptional regulator [bacterium]|nr:MAG: sigma-54-dependent Fis family transcriptional regulator [bacterium]